MHYIRQTDEQIFFTTGLGDLSEQTLPRNLLQQHSQRPTKAGSNKSRQHSSPPVVRGMVSHAVPQGTWSTSARSPLPAQQSTDSQRPTTAAQQPASGTWHGVSRSPPGHVVHQRTQLHQQAQQSRRSQHPTTAAAQQPASGTWHGVLRTPPGHVVHQRTQPTSRHSRAGTPAPNNSSSTAARQWNVAWCLTQSPRARGPPAHAAPPAGTAEQAQPAPNNSSSTAARQWNVAWCLTQSPRARGPPAHAAHQQAQQSRHSQHPTTPAAQQPASGTWHGVSHSPPGHVVHQRTQPTSRHKSRHSQHQQHSQHPTTACSHSSPPVGDRVRSIQWGIVQIYPVCTKSY